ncbi:hypothetical protein CY34DRAFT_798160 [Suillus luteus UH-Slu-Lm8-n1]|uniref:Uncharacterized protein n=1 Tax=Suillus luteus UH-Slu-Lm8-n1 TaxID=930992 RepID=A0A0D0ADN1_9AGAM|nr:hypothetical protein CY34DRAFT_798160 [Suillus luteus UH-Slu-Lm8-n1]
MVTDELLYMPRKMMWIELGPMHMRILGYGTQPGIRAKNDSNGRFTQLQVTVRT